MNRIYSLKYCHLTQGLIAVSELASRVSSKTGRKLLATFIVSALSYGAAEHAMQRRWIPILRIRDYLDLARVKVYSARSIRGKNAIKKWW